MSERALFFSVMRRPEMRLTRAALHWLKWEYGSGHVDWRDITSMEIVSIDPWTLWVNHHEIFTIWPEKKNPLFFVWALHNEDNPCCQCEECESNRTYDTDRLGESWRASI